MQTCLCTRWPCPATLSMRAEFSEGRQQAAQPPCSHQYQRLSARLESESRQCGLRARRLGQYRLRRRRLFKIGSEARHYLAAIDVDGAVMDWSPDANDEVLALAAVGSTVYVGGL